MTMPDSSGTLPRPLLGVPKQAWLLAGISGLLQILIFPSPALYWLCWVALVPLALALVQASEKSAASTFLAGYCSGIIWYAGSCFWIVHVMNTYGDLPLPVAIGILVLFALYLGLYHGLFGLLFGLCARRFGKVPAVLLAPILWVAVELARARITSVPWDLLGYTQVDNIPFTHLARFTGVYGMSFAIAAVNALFTLAFLKSGSQTLPAICAVLLASGIECGKLMPVAPEVPTAHAVLLQGNLPVDGPQWTEQDYNQTISSLIATTTEKKEGAILVVWPEEPAPFFENDARFQSWMTALAHDTHAYLIVSTLGVAMGNGAEDYTVFNSASLVNPQGRFLARYDKIHLVPWGEYVPYQKFFWFARNLTRDVGTFGRGSERKIFEVDGHKVGTFICYEAVFPDEVRQFADNGAELLVNISNDSWFGDYGAPWQHLNIARMRAIENHRWLLRDANSGVTAAIDPEGRVVAQLPRNQRLALSAPFAFLRGTTFYTRRGDVFAFSCAIITLVTACGALLPRNRPA